MRRRNFLAISAAAVLPSCEPPKPQARAWKLFSPEHQPGWHPSEMLAAGAVRWHDLTLSLGTGQPMTGVSFPNLESLQVPWDRYHIEFEARRVAGSDFFATLTLPIDSPATAVSLVIGGWGGTLVGISCIDGYDASENATTSHFDFQNGTWYRFKLELVGRWLKVWQDQRLIVNTNLKSRQLSLRGGEIVQCLPLGFATYLSEGEIRDFKIEEILS